MPDRPFPWGKALTLLLVAGWMIITVVTLLRGPSQHYLSAYEDER